jgi:cytochrome c-type biogenesis protein CcmH
MMLWIVLAVMAAVAAAGACLPLLRQAPRRPALGALVALVFAAALAGLYPLLGRPDLAALRPPPPAAGPGERPDPELVKDVPLLEARMRLTPGDPRGWRLLGMAYSRLGRFGAAADAYGRASELSPREPSDLSSQAEALVQAANGVVTPGARGLFARVLTLDPADARARYFLAMAKDEDGDHAGAMADWVALIKSAPPDAPWLADMRDFVGRVAAERGVDLSAELGAPAPPSGQAAMIRGMVDQLAARLKAQPRDADGWIRLMRSRMVLGEPAAASAALRDGLAAFDDSAPSQSRLREAAKAMGVSGA